MNSIEREIVRLSGIWYGLVGQEHHKDWDCHWTIETRYSYGGPPSHRAHHAGYAWGDWTGPKRDTYDLALIDLYDALCRALTDQWEWALRIKGSGDWLTEEYAQTTYNYLWPLTWAGKQAPLREGHFPALEGPSEGLKPAPGIPVTPHTSNASQDGF